MITGDINLEAKLIGFGLKSLDNTLKLKPWYFTKTVSKTAYKILSEYYLEKQVAPTRAVLKLELSKNGIIKPAEAYSFVKATKRLKHEDFALLLEKAEELHELREWGMRLETAAKYYEEGKIDKLKAMFLQEQAIESLNPQLSCERMSFSNLVNIFDKVDHIPTGFPALDKKLNGGFARGELTVFAAPMKSGKSAMLMSCWYNAYKNGFKSLLYSLEMHKETIEKRLLLLLAGKSFGQLKKLSIKESQEVRKNIINNLFINKALAATLYERTKDLPLQDFLGAISEAINVHAVNLYIYSKYAANINEIVPDLFKLRPDIVFIDYLNWLEPSRAHREAKIWERYGLVSKELKALARRLDCPIVTAMQLTEDKQNVKYSRMVAENADLILKWDLLEDGVVKVYNLETICARNVPAFNDLFIYADLNKMKLTISQDIKGS